VNIEFSLPAALIFCLFGSAVETPQHTVECGSGIPVYSTILAAWLACGVLIAFSLLATRNVQLIPGGLQNVAETIVEALLGLCEQVAGNRGRAFLPLVGTLFMFILVSNWMGILPLWVEFNWLHHGVPFTASHEAPLRSANSDLNVTAAMAVIVFLWVQVTRIRSSGLFGWIKHLTWGPPPILELISEIARPVSLALRLFGNILAGEVLLLVISSLVGILIPIVFMVFELFVGVVQALIFAILTLAFLALASAHHGGEEAHHEASH
jgi:F-type H+-transporting ATPase subunit a